MGAALKEEIIRMIEGFPEEMLRRVLDVINRLKGESATKTFDSRFDGLCGSITEQDAEIMRAAVAEREKIDLNAW